jgi:hypothetical protein
VNMESNLRGLDLLSSVTSKPWKFAKMLLEIKVMVISMERERMSLILSFSSYFY